MSIGYCKHRGELPEGSGFPEQSDKTDVDRQSNKW
jgi:hypothetical protein